MVVHDDKLRDQQINYSSSREGLHSSRDSRDPGVAADGVEIRMGREWRAVELLQVMESRLRHRATEECDHGQSQSWLFPQDRSL